MTTLIIVILFVLFALPTLVVALGLVVWSNDIMRELDLENNTELETMIRA